MSQVNVEILDDNKELVGKYIVKRLTVGLNARRLRLNAPIIDSELSDQEKGQMLTCAALASTLCDEDGELIYSGDDGAEKIYNEMDIEEFDALCQAYVELNPLEPTLTAKKKKS